ncbi:uncharacterized protein LOC494784 precursor [Xenopus laevis]|uniref:Pentraxin family member n=2 Tax=Xenopus laevis TaxID=8355 RepID=Q63ZL1_XENLA|nr:C-reactive protein-like precursor [Xenopus laevis]AAH82901.1 LOC494784 protein [Xenopus laevis]OCT69012.1 hypothetical protein XELAEV_18040320mg [Xenopus laevis]
MELHLWLLLIAGSMADQNMRDNVFLFPSQSASDYVLLTPKMTGPLQKLTVCLRSNTDRGGSALFTVGTPESRIRNIFSILPFTMANPYFYCKIYINNTDVTINAKADVLSWIHMCVTWDSNTGVVELWVNGRAFIRRVLQKGFSIDLQEGIALGQMRRNSRREWETALPFQGEITDVNMWNSVLSPGYIKQVQQHHNMIGNVISWWSLNYTIKGNVIVQPKSIWK